MKSEPVKLKCATVEPSSLLADGQRSPDSLGTEGGLGMLKEDELLLADITEEEGLEMAGLEEEELDSTGRALESASEWQYLRRVGLSGGL